LIKGSRIGFRALSRGDLPRLHQFNYNVEVELAGGGNPPLPQSLERLRLRRKGPAVPARLKRRRLRRSGDSGGSFHETMLDDDPRGPVFGFDNRAG
jgi:hypothetical protein